ncbi:MAG: Rrf2 family transcriptional regulator [Dictyoglomus sp.]|nr:Rrf2 family transcriptional regulator [Dictyoglomus sp.]MCX7942195.1 Rrf2 family transcriptional regulator [Dictyoglomaceae bacterium]MDW8188658.1 Rrf2 family transcriptional regulator [Dictyoglomus sp.]
MFRVSARLDCSIRALVLLGKTYGKEVLSLNKIAEKEGISKDFLAQLMLDLKKANIVESFKGVSGGYILKKPPSEINLKEIFEAIEGPLSIIECIHTSEETCKIQSICSPKKAWEYIEKKISEALESLTLEDLIMGIERKEELLSI